MEKFTDEQIIKALECFKSDECLGGECPYASLEGLCGKPMCEDVYDFVYRQKAEIERLRKETSQTIESIRKLARDTIRDTKSEAYKEFAEMLCKDRVSNDPVVIAVKVELEELTEGGNEE